MISEPSEPKILRQLRQRAQRRGAVIALAEGDDPRVVRAAARARAEGICQPVLIGDSEAVLAVIQEEGCPSDLEIRDPSTDPKLPALAEHLGRRLKKKGYDRQRWEEMARDRLYYACLSVACGACSGAVMGAVATTAATLRAALHSVGPKPGLDTVSSCFLMVLPDERTLIFSDCGVVPDPSPRQLADIAEAAAESYRGLLGEEPRVALLSFSTLGSAVHPRVEKVREALLELQRRGVGFSVDGELQADAALVAEVARRKAPGSEIAGRANVLIFPDLDSGNIAYKLTERLAGAWAIGPLLQGLSGPIHDLSRGCSTEDIVNTMAIAALQGEKR